MSSSGKTIFDQRVDARLDHASGYASYRRDQQWSNAVTDHYALNLRVMVGLCARAGVPLLLVNPGSNLRDCPPFKSENKSPLAPELLASWEDYFQRASELEEADPAAALPLYRQAAAIDDQHAQLIYDIARCLDRLERYEEARDAYIRAKELDVCPLRILGVMQQSVLELAQTTSTPLVDAARLLEEQSPHGLVGYNWYVDQVHPSIRGHQLIAQAIAAKLIQERIVASPAAPWSAPDRRTAYRQQLERLGDQYLAAGRRRVEWLEKWARRDRLRFDPVPLDARANLDLAGSYVEFAEYDKAVATYRIALQQDPALAAQLLDRALQLFQSGRSSSARKVAQVVLDSDAGQAWHEKARFVLALLALNDGLADVASQYIQDLPNDQHRLDQMCDIWLDEVPQARGLLQ